MNPHLPSSDVHVPECVELLLKAYARAEAGHSIDWEDINEAWAAAKEEFPEAAAEAERQAALDAVEDEG